MKTSKKRSSPKLEHFFPQIQMKTEKKKKKGLHQKWNNFFPSIQVDTYAQMHTRVKLLGGDADVDRTQTIAGHTAKLLSPHPPWFRHPCYQAWQYGRLRFALFVKVITRKRVRIRPKNSVNVVVSL